MIWDPLVAYFSHVTDVWAIDLESRAVVDWLLFFAPVILLEVPQYYVPLLGLAIARALGLPRVDRRLQANFLRKAPMVSIVVAGRNEAGTIEACIRSLLDQSYPNFEIIIVDDHSDDDTFAVARRYARDGRVRAIRNHERTGRTGRPVASNLGTRLANGEFIVSLDADTTFDRGLLENLIAPFSDPEVGVVAGNVLVRNVGTNMLTRLQNVEYFLSIDVHKRWSTLLGSTLQASGAIGAFRRSALRDLKGFDPELAEDGDISLRMVKAGWRVVFAPRAVALTDVPDSLRTLIGQRTRWDRGGLRTYFSKHGRLLLPSVAGGRRAYAMWVELILSNLMPLVHPFYLVWLLSHGIPTFLFVYLATWTLYIGLSLLSVGAIAVTSERAGRPSTFLWPAVVAPFYRGFMRWVKIRALVMELLRVRYEDSYLPESAWRHAPRF